MAEISVEFATQEFTFISGTPTPALGGRCTHSPRLDRMGIVGWTDAETDRVFSVPSTSDDVKEYKQLT